MLNLKLSWLTFKIFIPSQFLGYEECYSFRIILEDCIRALTKKKISPVNVALKYFREKNDFFKNPCIEIKTRSSKTKREWLNVPELSFIFLEWLKLLDSPKILKEKLNKAFMEEFKI